MESTIKYFTENELNSIFRVLEHRRRTAATELAYKNAVRDEALFRVMFYCALRVSEVILLNIEDYNILKKEMHCKRLKGGINNTLKIIDNSVLQALNRHIRENAPSSSLFMNIRDDKPLSRKTIDYIVKNVCMDAKVPSRAKWHSHTFRHTKAIELAESGLDIKEIQYWLGHKCIANTQLYFEFTSSQHTAMYKKLLRKKRLGT
jgi:site-specific recombinase XerD